MQWNPVRELNAIQQRLGSLFSRNPLGPLTENLNNAEWAPLVDISEDDKEYLFTAELPDMKKEDVKVTAENGTLRISGERKIEEEKKGQRYHRIERAYGSFERSFALPDGAKKDAVTAEYKDGVLKVHVPKSEPQKPKVTEVPIH